MSTNALLPKLVSVRQQVRGPRCPWDIWTIPTKMSILMLRVHVTVEANLHLTILHVRMCQLVVDIDLWPVHNTSIDRSHAAEEVLVYVHCMFGLKLVVFMNVVFRSHPPAWTLIEHTGHGSEAAQSTEPVILTDCVPRRPSALDQALFCHQLPLYQRHLM